MSRATSSAFEREVSRMIITTERDDYRDRLKPVLRARVQGAVHVHIGIENFDLEVFEIGQLRRGGSACSGERREGAFSANELGGDENVDLIDKLRVEKCAQKLAAAFDEQVGHSAPAQLGENRARVNSIGSVGLFARWAFEDFGPLRAQARDTFSRRSRPYDDDQRNRAGGAH